MSNSTAADEDSGEGYCTENISSNQHIPEENNEGYYKWICESCTYQNWMASKSCVMCLSKRYQTAQMISDNNVNQGSNTGRLVARKLSTPTIAEAANFKASTSGSPPQSTLSCSPPNYTPLSKLHSRSSSPASHYNNIANYLALQHVHQSGAAAVSTNDGVISDNNDQHYQLKWSCAQCTYLNLPKYPKCIQCLSSRKKVSPAVSRNSPVSPRQAGINDTSNSFAENVMQHNIVYGNKSNRNQYISPSYRPQSTSPPPKTLHNLGSAFDCLRINALDDSMSNNERNRNNSSPPHSQIQSRSVGIQEKKNQYQLQNKEKNIRSQNRVMSPPIISNAVSPSTTAQSTLSSPTPPPLATCYQKKWNCPACTYENWPKSNNCIICGTRVEKVAFNPEGNRESPSPEEGSSSQHENVAKNVRPGVQQSNLIDSPNSQISPILSARGVQTPRYFTQAEILTNSAPTTSNGGSNQVYIFI